METQIIILEEEYEVSVVQLFIKERLERLELPLPLLAWGISAIWGITLGLHWKLRTLDKPFDFPCPQAVWGAIRGGFILKLLC